MDGMIGEIVASVVTALIAFAWRHFELGKYVPVKVVHAVVEGVEQGTRELEEDKQKLVKQQIKARAEATGAQARLHAIVERITKEKA